MNNQMKETESYLSMHTEKVGSVTLNTLKKKYGTYERAFKNIPTEHHLLSSIQKVSIQEQSKSVPILLSTMNNLGIRLVRMDEAEFPQQLKETASPPAALYIKGKMPIGRCIGVVGTRKVTSYGKAITEMLCRAMVSEKVIIVSGLAMGVDAVAHIVSVHEGMPTVAVMACGLEQVYPRGHQGLADKIIESGCIISEFPLFTPPYPGNFIIRNRIIAGMSEAILVTEASDKSGSLVTAKYAGNYNRDILAVPGSILSQESRGTNSLIKHGAIPITAVEDLRDYLGIASTSYQFELPELESKILGRIALAGTSLNELASALNLDIALLSSKVIMLEIKGVVERQANGVYRRISKH